MVRIWPWASAVTVAEVHSPAATVPLMVGVVEAQRRAISISARRLGARSEIMLRMSMSTAAVLL